MCSCLKYGKVHARHLNHVGPENSSANLHAKFNLSNCIYKKKKPVYQGIISRGVLMSIIPDAGRHHSEEADVSCRVMVGLLLRIALN